MRVELAAKAGFCFGVKRAVDTVYERSDSDAHVYTYGPIIHNEAVISDLKNKGVRIVEEICDAEALPRGTIVIRSHGVSRSVQEKLIQSGHEIVDATCPFVKKIHRIVEEYSAKGYEIIIIGAEDHPEVQGITGWADPGCVHVVSSPVQIEKLPLSGEKNICIVAQTTFNYNKFKDLVEIIQKKVYDRKGTVDTSVDIAVHNTICSATKERQEAAKELSGQVDAMIVIGGVSSSNTKKLYDICSENCQNTYFIQTKEDLEHSDFSRFDYVGITAGASTPNKIIEEVQKYVRNEF